MQLDAPPTVRQVYALVPELIWAEIGQGLWKHVRWRSLAAADAELVATRLALFPARSEPLQRILPAALQIALASTLTVYDACYLALAVAAKATLVTFDKDFVGLYDRVELLS